MTTRDTLEDAITDSIGFFDGLRVPHALLWLDVMYRRFGIGQFANALQQFDKLLPEQPEQQLPVLRVFRRMADPENPLSPEDFQAVTHPSDLIVAYALYCDREGLPEVYPKALARAVEQGGYFLTHALLAWIWICENGCDPDLPEGFIDDVCRANAAIVNDDPTIVSDLRLEAAAFLHLAGHGALIDPEFVRRVVSIQNADGGWGGSGGSDGNAGSAGSDWHSTVLGLLLLLHVRSATDGEPPAGIAG